jgi:diguanylate cyclase (GGDEF)-like protein
MEILSFILIALVIYLIVLVRENKKLKDKLIQKDIEHEYEFLIVQKTLDAQKSISVVLDDEGLIFVNRTLLDLVELRDINEFKQDYECISDLFEKVLHNDSYLTKYVKQVFWIDHIQKEKTHQQFKVLMKFGNSQKEFDIIFKDISIKDKNLYLIVFHEIKNKTNHDETKATVDTLTKLFSKERFDMLLDNEMKLATTTRSTLSIIVVDIDSFEKVKDKYGEDTSNNILIDFADILHSSVRGNDFLARWSDDKFIMAFLTADRDQAKMIANKVRQKVENHSFVSVGKLTASFGVSQFIYNETSADLLTRANKALYRAKEKGKNRVEVL